MSIDKAARAHEEGIEGVAQGGPRRAHIIVNPYGGKKLGTKMMEQAKSVLDESGVEVLVHPTEYAGHAIEYAKSLELRKGDVLCPVGGDGTLYEIINGLFAREDSFRVPIGLIPAGSYNYFAQSLGLKMDDGHFAAARMLDGCIRNVDIARVTSRDKVAYTASAATWGFLVDLVECAERKRWMGIARYKVAGFHELWKNKGRDARVTIDGEQVEGTFSFFMALNTEYMGREKVIFPNASIDDGKWDLIYCKEMGKLRFANVMAKMNKADGSWLELEDVHTRSFRNLELVCENPEDQINLDGEINLTSPIKIEVLPGAVQMMGPDFCHPEHTQHIEGFETKV